MPRHRWNEQFIALLRALEVEPRYDVLHVLADGPAGLEEIAERLGVAPYELEPHLEALTDAGILVCWNDRYALGDPVDVVSTTEFHLIRVKASDSDWIEVKTRPHGA